MPVSQFQVGSIIEDLKSNSIYEITGVVINTHFGVEYYSYTVKTLVNPMDLQVEIISIATVEELALVHFFNVEAKVNPQTGLVEFLITTMYEEDYVRLAAIEVFVKNYFSEAKLYTKDQTKYRVELESLEQGMVRVTRLSNVFEKFLFKKEVVFKVISVEELLEEYQVHVLAQ